MKKSTLLLVLFLLCFSTMAMAGVATRYDYVTTGDSSKSNTNYYAGLNWDLGGGATPELVLGVFKTKVDLDGDTRGGNLAFHVNLAGGIKPGKLKLGYLNGKDDIQGLIGFGYNFLNTKPLIFLGVNGPYVSAGVDGYFDSRFVPYGQLHSQGKFDKPKQTTSCVEVVGGPYNQPDCTNIN